MSEIVKAYRFNDEKGYWEQLTQYEGKDGEMVSEWCGCVITDVPVEDLIGEWESLVAELSNKEVELLKLKEFIAVKSFEIEQETDFKALYGKNNADVRKHHIKTELADVYDDVTGLELSINWIKSYIPLLKEVLKYKRQVKIFGE